MGVHHHHAPNRKFDFFLFLHPLDGSLVEKHFEDLAKPDRSAHSLLATICDDPFRLHVLPHSCYLGNWRWYLRYLGAQFQEKVPHLFLIQEGFWLTSPKNDEALTLDLRTTAGIGLNFDQIQSLRHLHDTVLSLNPFCNGSLDVIKTLESIHNTTFSGIYSLSCFSEQLRGYDKSLSVLSSRIRNAIDLVGLRKG